METDFKNVKNFEYFEFRHYLCNNERNIPSADRLEFSRVTRWSGESLNNFYNGGEFLGTFWRLCRFFSHLESGKVAII